MIHIEIEYRRSHLPPRRPLRFAQFRSGSQGEELKLSKSSPPLLSEQTSEDPVLCRQARSSAKLARKPLNVGCHPRRHINIRVAVGIVWSRPSLGFKEAVS